MGAAAPLLRAAILLALSPGRAAAAPCDPVCPAGTFVARAGCGREAICQRCPTDTFSSVAGSRSCDLCRKCEGRFTYLKVCSPISDAECTCKEGYRCSDDGCSRCDRSCGPGKERTGSDCQACRYGTFNDQPDGSCKNWTVCSENQVLEPGTATKDVLCKHSSDNPPLATTLPRTSPAIPFPIAVPGKDLQLDVIRISLAVAGLLCTAFLLPLCVCLSVWQKKKLHAVFKKTQTTPEQSVQEETCSCRFPEEEQGEDRDCGKPTEFRNLLEN
ncbi:tumor necrosis factor receptor superfamily member 9 [Excalfactoria chinensis]|uniref:tumor necrosis factor receptor superfamily member 9 n=1 Tax=Excalfactoria chinensis TaxID=46218 RepID=UPI003B3A64A6